MSCIEPVKLSLMAMATKFELILFGDDPMRLRAVGEEALREIELLDAQLSFYSTQSEISWINRGASNSPVKVEPRLFKLLSLSKELTKLTDGSFDITIGPLMKAWSFFRGSGERPEVSELSSTLNRVGMDKVLLDDERFEVSFMIPGLELDLGAIGKGYAIERAVNVLIEHGVSSALIHGGTSSVHAIGTPIDGESWKIGLEEPFNRLNGAVVIELKDNSLSVSAVHGKSFWKDGKQFGHVIDPRCGEPVSGSLAAAVVGESPTICDALSSALLVLGESWLPTLKERFSNYSGVVVPVS
jgi:FAD:protein FMN transferase